MQPGTIVSNRYQLLDLIGTGGMGAVYRAYDRLTGDTVALKQVTIPGEQLEFTSSSASMDFRLALAEEFKTLATLRHPNIISVLDYGFDANRQPYFTMELLQNAHTIVAASEDQPFNTKTALLVQVLQAMLYLHRRGIIHRDLKPDNVLVVNGQVKVLDFGLAIARQYLTNDTAHVVGTLAYMAPEVLQGTPATEASDLYAIGVIAYQMFAGQYPFDMDDLTSMIYGIMYKVPDVAPLDLDERLARILQKLLAKDPSDRFQDVATLLVLYADAIQQPALYETATIRESLLQAARFVGRERELRLLTDALHRSLDGKGSTWLIAGESGVGKTRLMDELRTVALVNGALVLRGQAVQEGGAPYQVFRPVLRRLCLQTDISDFEAAVLRQLVPDIHVLLNRPLDDLPEIDPKAAQTRLLTTIEAVFRRQKQPIVMLMEDLQWAVESLVVIRHLSRVAGELPLMMVGSYRDDERSNLTDHVPGVWHIKLDRLSEKEIADLSASMLGDKIGRQSAVVDLLQRETEGNVYFIVEVVRALAEDAGQLHRIGDMTLPPSVFAGGINTVVQRRLRRVPEEALPLLRLAAVGGRDLDLMVLPNIPAPMDFDTWLYVCEMETILELRDAHWRFAHDKIREALLSELTPTVVKGLHRQMAAAIEKHYPDDPSKIIILAYHWSSADEPGRGCYSCTRAGQQLLELTEYNEAREFFRRAFTFADRLPEAERLTILHIELLQGLADCLLHTGVPEEAEEHYQTSVALARRLDHGAGVAKGLEGQAYTAYRTGRYEEAETLYRECLTQALKLGDSVQQMAALGGIALITRTRGDYESVRNLWNWALELAQTAKYEAGISRAYNGLADAARMMNELEEAEQLFGESLRIARRIGNRQGVAFALREMGDVAQRRGNVERALQLTQEAHEVNQYLGDIASLAYGLLVFGHIRLKLNNLEQAREHYQEALKLALNAGLMRVAVFAVMGAAQVEAQWGSREQAISWASAAMAHLAADHELRLLGETLIASVGDDFPKETVELIQQRGANWSLENTTEVILAL
jgi:tetratricopeptide (TPR) repeat protein